MSGFLRSRLRTISKRKSLSATIEGRPRHRRAARLKPVNIVRKTSAATMQKRSLDPEKARKPMPDVSRLKFICSSFCTQYHSEAKFYIDEAHASGMRHLVVVYENGEPDFLAGIPDKWADENVQDLIFWPMKNPNSPYPAWEVPARAYGSPMLYAWWKGGAPPQVSR